MDLVLTTPFIKLVQALKAAHLTENGGEAKEIIKSGLVKVNGSVELRRGKKLISGDVVSYKEENIYIK